MRARAFVLLTVTLALAGTPVLAQESQVGADFRREGEHLAKSCGDFNAKAIFGCAYTLTTDYPLHFALGSLSPQNGFAFGAAFSERYTPNEGWRLTWSGDLVAAPSGSWRGGAYMKIVRTPGLGVSVAAPGSTAAGGSVSAWEHPVVDIYAQAVSLDTISFFGTGPSSAEDGRSVYGERQTIVGGTGTFPLSGLTLIGGLRPALIAGISGRFVTIRSGKSGDVPSIEQVYGEADAPGLTEQSPFVEFHEGLRFKPSVANGRLRFNYLFAAQQFRAGNGTPSSFNRWTADLRHEIPIYRGASSSGPRAFNGPNECAQAVGSPACPPVSWSRNRQGTIGVRLLVSASTTSGGNQVPFYFQPTLGGSDLNGERLLASYQDYRFRAPNLLALQESVEHALWGPIGVFIQAEQGKVAEESSGLDFNGLKSSVTVGLTLRAGGFPMVNLSFSWGSEGNHVIGSMSPTLLGGSARPSLY
jgi:hypothetical protein